MRLCFADYQKTTKSEAPKFMMQYYTSIATCNIKRELNIISLTETNYAGIAYLAAVILTHLVHEKHKFNITSVS